jgi:hypothetical protein
MSYNNRNQEHSPEALKVRTQDFALRVIKMYSSLPKFVSSVRTTKQKQYRQGKWQQK